MLANITMIKAMMMGMAIIPSSWLRPESLIWVFAILGIIRIAIHAKKYGVEIVGLIQTLITVVVLLVLAAVIYLLATAFNS